MSALIIDTETTGTEEPRPVEIAWVALGPCGIAPPVLDHFEQRFNPLKPITLGALATHHIMDEDLADAPPYLSFQLPPGISFLIGHNVDFDWRVIGEPDIPRICTLAMCRKLWPGADSHTQSAMLYHLMRSRARDLCRGAHSALEDVKGCYLILLEIIRETGVTTWGELWELSEVARVPEIMPFGKHKGERIENLPCDYVGWLLRQSDVDPYLVKALRGR